MRCRADTGGIPSLHSLHLSSQSALLVSSLFGVSALLGGWSSFSLRALFSRLQELTDKLAVMLEGHSCLFESHSPSHVNTDPAGNHSFHNPQMKAVSSPFLFFSFSCGVQLADINPVQIISFFFPMIHSVV